MMRKKRIIFIVAIVLFGIQFLPSFQNRSEQSSENDIGKIVPVSPEIDAILKKSCYDCHSNNTNYPWYANIQPVRFWLDHHIKEGKEELNFNEFGSYNKRRQLKKMEEIGNTIKEGEMPLSSYTLIHRDSKLTDNQKKVILAWVDASRSSLSTP